MLSEGSEEQGEDVLQESFQELQQRRFCARAKLLRATAAQLQGGRLCVVSGETGQGKTVFVVSREGWKELALERKDGRVVGGESGRLHFRSLACLISRVFG